MAAEWHILSFQIVKKFHYTKFYPNRWYILFSVIANDGLFSYISSVLRNVAKFQKHGKEHGGQSHQCCEWWNQ